MLKRTNRITVDTMELAKLMKELERLGMDNRCKCSFEVGNPIVTYVDLKMSHKKFEALKALIRMDYDLMNACEF